MPASPTQLRQPVRCLDIRHNRRYKPIIKTFVLNTIISGPLVIRMTALLGEGQSRSLGVGERGGPMRIILTIDETGADSDLLDTHTARLRKDFRSLDIDADPARLPAPEGSKALDGAMVGTLILSLASAPELLRSVTDVVCAWLRRNPGGRTAELTVGNDTIKLTGVTSAQQDLLIEAFVDAAKAER